ncbi:hypothetical protein TWF106_008726 [Orbilia oligospora]|uniref:Cyanovirin-N domain-containing protein n=1 Tax=Orbilia oligospora TaxID=2813651 RepID=A0A6G1MG36_ORBOL|nr:hypothetical protein TWF106_008726 [Orbilia oligospora]KAF3229927.1 hypothetical protein TWF191_000832 [Orbilia oligospora]KAF3257164.1 hypothetical protein TWF192_001440 [Orbilia oligospora]
MKTTQIALSFFSSLLFSSQALALPTTSSETTPFYYSETLALPTSDAVNLEKRALATLTVIVCQNINGAQPCVGLDVTGAQVNQCINFQGAWNDSISSLRIGTTPGWGGCEFYLNWGCDTAILPAPNGAQYFDLRYVENNLNRNDMISSFRCVARA